MELELSKKIFKLEDYLDKKAMEQEVKEFIKELKHQFPLAIVTKEFCNGKNVLVRATQMNHLQNKRVSEKDEQELEKEEVRIKEKGINGLGENVHREKSPQKTEERELEHGGSQRERGGR